MSDRDFCRSCRYDRASPRPSENRTYFWRRLSSTCGCSGCVTACADERSSGSDPKRDECGWPQALATSTATRWSLPLWGRDLRRGDLANVQVLGRRLMRRFVLYVLLTAAACGQVLWGQTQPAQTSTSNEYREAYERSFRAAFREKGIIQCRSSAPQATAAGYDITPTCTCAADTLLATKTVGQLEELSRSPTNELAVVAMQCLRTNPPVVVSKP